MAMDPERGQCAFHGPLNAQGELAMFSNVMFIDTLFKASIETQDVLEDLIQLI